MVNGLGQFREIVLADFEFVSRPGERPQPFCLVAHELVSGREIRLFGKELQDRREAPYDTGPETLFVAYYASAEVGCHLSLGWNVPERILDPFTEFRNQSNGLALPFGSGLLGALAYHGLDTMTAVEKEAMRALALRGAPWTAEEQQSLTDYCESDALALKRLLPAMAPKLDVPRGVLRGRYMAAAARMEHVGTPVDTDALAIARRYWPEIQTRLIERIDQNYGVFEGRTFKADRFARYLVEHGLPWPRLASGALALDDDTFRLMARMCPEVAPLRELRHALSEMRLEELAVGADGRNRCLLSAFRARTGRNQPSNNKFIFGPAVWLRGLIRPPEGYGLAYIDWSQQEFGIAAALSGDPAMLAAYSSGDPYLTFGILAGAIPPGGTKASHGAIRDKFKACALAVQYSMGAESLAAQTGLPVAEARELLRLHHQTYPKFWRWSDAAVDCAMLHGELSTVFGWTIHTSAEANPRSMRNFPMQANGAEMLRLACSLATERGITVCAPVHDALLIEAPLAELDDVIAATQRAMLEASAGVLDGFELRSEASIIRYPDRYSDPRGTEMWGRVWDIIREIAPADALRVMQRG